ncbi:nickel pincer cofactor biosynthesis protein LarC [Desulfospira joergensenii]|uniref:nickel pincer cofactor biosynthesis protein LarC n=1 Tax=Desulfospira joergensenii TaxID=53329 RepID=UPI0003B658B2|nr:nickel pincer cofactor biosynthesis protein LarC [Desulfospira joergensenii]
MILYLDIFSGISGDMTLGAFVDLGVEAAWIEEHLTSLFAGFGLKTETVYRHHLKAVDLFVEVRDDQTSRQYTDIKKIIIESDLSEFVKEKSLEAFERIARAESAIHGHDMDHIHFHEIGGIDSMVDIIGSFLCVEKLGITRVVASKIPLGSGFIKCAHGRIPVPVPAVAAILKGVPVTGSDAKTEIVTPTGAAIAVTLAQEFGPIPEMEIQGVGYGAGKRDTGSGLPNLLRMVMGKPVEKSREDNERYRDLPEPEDPVFVIHTHLDDTSPEILGFVMELLLEQGALDVSYTPVQMKKNRPGTRIEVLTKPEDLHRLSDLVLAQTSSIGLRYFPCQRKVLKRELVYAKTSFGRIQVKKVYAPDHSHTLVPEYEVLKAIAMEKNLPLKDVYARVMAEANFLDTEGPKR